MDIHSYVGPLDLVKAGGIEGRVVVTLSIKRGKCIT